MLNCTDVERLREESRAVETWILFGLSAGFGLLLLLRGRHVVRTVGATIAAGAAALAVFSWIPSSSCDARLAAAGVAAAVAAVIVLCLSSLAVLVLAAGSGGFVAHAVYELLPLSTDASPPFSLLGLSGYHVLVVGGGAAAGGLLALLKRATALRLTAAAAGASLVVAALFLLSAELGWDVPYWVALLLLATLTPLSAFVLQQRTTCRRRERHVS